MGGELVGEASPPPNYTEAFTKAFPFYLSIGMTYDQYWEQDASLPRYYREAYRIKNDARNQEMWLQGLYFLHAINTAIGNAFADKGSEPLQYLSEPLPLSKMEAEARRDREEKVRMERLKVKMQQRMASLNRKFPKEGG